MSISETTAAGPSADPFDPVAGDVAPPRDTYGAGAAPADAAPADTDSLAVIGPNAAALAAPWSALRRLPLMMIAATPWFFYRKMYVAGAASLAATLGLLLLARGWPPATLALAVLALALVQGLATGPAYRRFVRSRIAKADTRRLAGGPRRHYLQRAGGTSAAAAMFCVAIILPLLIAAGYTALLRGGVL